MNLYIYIYVYIYRHTCISIPTYIYIYTTMRIYGEQRLISRSLNRCAGGLSARAGQLLPLTRQRVPLLQLTLPIRRPHASRLTTDWMGRGGGGGGSGREGREGRGWGRAAEKRKERTPWSLSRQKPLAGHSQATAAARRRHLALPGTQCPPRPQACFGAQAAALSPGRGAPWRSPARAMF
jgi:hypothetical protein